LNLKKEINYYTTNKIKNNFTKERKKKK